MSKKSNEDLVTLLQKVYNAGTAHAGFELLQGICVRHGKSKIEECVEEIRLDGSNTFGSIWRKWEGVDYDEIVEDVAKKLGIDDRNIKGKTIEDIEFQILKKIVEEHWNDLPDDKRKDKLSQIDKLSRLASRDVMSTALKPSINGIAGPAFRKTIPTVVSVALLRMMEG